MLNLKKIFFFLAINGFLIRESFPQNSTQPGRVKKSKNIAFENTWSQWAEVHAKGDKKILFSMVQLDEATQSEKWLVESFRKNLLLASLAYELNLPKNYSSSPLIVGQSLLDSFGKFFSSDDFFNMEQSLDLVRFDVSKNP